MLHAIFCVGSIPRNQYRKIKFIAPLHINKYLYNLSCTSIFVKISSPIIYINKIKAQYRNSGKYNAICRPLAGSHDLAKHKPFSRHFPRELSSARARASKKFLIHTCNASSSSFLSSPLLNLCSETKFKVCWIVHLHFESR